MAKDILEPLSDNPRLQCSVCGHWMRLHGKDENGLAIQRFYSCCGPNGEYEHLKNVCAKCCDEKCPFDPSKNKTLSNEASI